MLAFIAAQINDSILCRRALLSFTEIKALSVK